jgi:hypothetical protein
VEPRILHSLDQLAERWAASGKSAPLGAMPAASPRGRVRRLLCRAIYVLTSIALSGCGAGNGPGQLLVAPGTYDAYHCKDLTQVWDQLNKRETELRANMDRASQGTGGTVIGAAAYGTDYQVVLTQKKMVQQEAAAKNCELVKSFQSDQTVR